MIKILVIEDEKRVADLLKIGLEENGYQVLAAYDGEMGRRLFQSNDFQLIISDIILPKLNGFELCQEIRKADEEIPILMLTALGTADDKLEGFDVGADDYMVKPFDFRELLARVRVLLKRRAVAKVDVVKEISYANLCINLERQEVTRNGEPIKLSPKEYNLLVYLVENAEKVVSRVENTRERIILLRLPLMTATATTTWWDFRKPLSASSSSDCRCSSSPAMFWLGSHSNR